MEKIQYSKDEQMIRSRCRAILRAVDDLNKRGNSGSDYLKNIEDAVSWINLSVKSIRESQK